MEKTRQPSVRARISQGSFRVSQQTRGGTRGASGRGGEALRTHSQMVSSRLISRSAPQPAMTTTPRGGTVVSQAVRVSSRDRRYREDCWARRLFGTYR